VIVNDGTIEDLHKKVDEVWRTDISGRLDLRSAQIEENGLA
jgi:hypothetical protein